MPKKIAKKILVVDDEPDICDLLARFLKEKGHSVSTAQSGQKAISLARKSPLDLAILDLRMPGMDGIKTLRQLKNINSDIEVIILTGHGDLKTAKEAMRLGAYDYVTKPLNLEFVEDLVQEVFE